MPGELAASPIVSPETSPDASPDASPDVSPRLVAAADLVAHQPPCCLLASLLPARLPAELRDAQGKEELEHDGLTLEQPSYTRSFSDGIGSATLTALLLIWLGR